MKKNKCKYCKSEKVREIWIIENVYEEFTFINDKTYLCFDCGKITVIKDV